MCPVPKAVQETPEKEATALPIAAVDVTTNIDTSAGSSNLIHNIAKIPSIENIVQQIQIDNDESAKSSLSSDRLSISICSDNDLDGTKTDSSICLNKCFLHSPKCINKCRQCRYSVENCSNLTFQEETKLHHLYSIATDWTLLIDRQAANCRNISDEVFPSIYLGDRSAAKNAFYLTKIGVTHVLNTAEGKKVGLVDTNENYYYPYGIKYMGLKLFDVAQTNISKHFLEVSDFIDEALNEGGKVLVNCLKGMSRSSTVVLAYLMLRKNMTAMDALTVVRRHRSICPNDGFLQQLAELDNKLRRERGQLQSRSPTQTPVK